MTSERVNEMWTYIESHQDETFENIALQLGVSEEMAKSLAFDWALGDKKRFEDRLNSNVE